jgi:high-affinity iron transporter
VSFLAVYREMFEIVLFYQALWIQAGEPGRAPLLGGAIAASALLALIGVALFKYSLRLPIGPFFGAMSALLALLAVVFAGHGVAALQEAGVMHATRLGFDPIPLLGLYPSLETLAIQGLVLVLVALGVWNAQPGRHGRSHMT